MAWGGGIYTVQNKILPGAYFKFESEAGTNNVFSDRGTVALVELLSWGPSGITTLTRSDFIKNSEKILGYEYTHEKMKSFRELFYGAEKVILYRLGSGVQASNANAQAIYAGVRGNDLSIAIAAKESQFVVTTKLKGVVVDEQIVGAADELVANDWVTFTATELRATSEDTPLTGGTNGTALAKDHQNALSILESYSFDVLVCTSSDELIRKLYEEWTKYAIGELGKYHQLVVHKDTTVNNKYVVSVHNTVKDAGAPAYALVYYVAGIEAACAVNKDLTAHDYMGEYMIDGDISQAELVTLEKQGQLVFHRVDNQFTILNDLNTFKNWADDTEANFRYNQVIRVLNQRANDVQKLFTKYYLGKAGIDAAARMLFKNDLVSNMEKGLLRVGAVMDYVSDDTIVERGEQSRSYYVRERIKPNMAVTHLYHDIVLTREGE